MLPDRLDRHAADALRASLDDFDVGGRLLHIRTFIWRGGELQLRVEDGNTLIVEYALTASWPAAVFEPAPASGASGLVAARQPVLEGRWVRGTDGYELRVGIDQAVPSAIYLRAHRLLSHVPFVGRPKWQVVHGLQGELSAYVRAFLSHQPAVPQATLQAAERLRALAALESAASGGRRFD